MVEDIGASKASQLTREFLESNYGNILLLMYRIISVHKNTKKDNYKVLCSILPNLGASERVYYLLKIDMKKKIITEVFKGKLKKKNGEEIIVIEKMPEKNDDDNLEKIYLIKILQPNEHAPKIFEEWKGRYGFFRQKSLDWIKGRSSYKIINSWMIPYQTALPLITDSIEESIDSIKRTIKNTQSSQFYNKYRKRIIKNLEKILKDDKNERKK